MSPTNPLQPYGNPVSMDKVSASLEKVPSEIHPTLSYEAAQANYDELIKMMDGLRRIVPEELYNRAMNERAKARRPGKGSETELLRAFDQLNFVYNNYQRMLHSPRGSISFEEELWIYEEPKIAVDQQIDNRRLPGLIKQLSTQISRVWVLTNLRAFCYVNDTKLLFAKGLLLSDISVENLERDVGGNRIGKYTEKAAKYAADTTTKEGDYSRGDVVFSFQDKETFRFEGITDPENVQTVIENVKEQQRAALNR